jgi:acetyl esterase
MEGLFRTLATAGRLHPEARPERHGVEVLRNIAYRPTGMAEHRLDIYRPSRKPGPWPVVLYIHGGAFRMLSKESHWVMGLAFARSGYLVANINYRLAPRNPFPAAIEDACAAATWLHKHAAAYGGDPSRLVVAGESAGANLATSVALACAYRRPEPYARAVFDAGVHPRAVLASCGVLQVSSPERFWKRRRMPAWLRDRLQEVTDCYLSGSRLQYPGELDLADPLVALERAEPPQRPLPPFYAVVGTRDPLLDDTRRLKAALDRMQVPCEAIYYPGEVHAFHALIWRSVARRCWRDTFKFLEPLVALRAAAQQVAQAAE